jgi:hypothetical protein
VSHWLIALGLTPFLFLASGIVPLVNRFRTKVATTSTDTSDGSVSDPAGKKKALRSYNELLEEAATKEQRVRAAWHSTAPPCVSCAVLCED